MRFRQPNLRCVNTVLTHKAKTYTELYDTFQWDIPERYNIGVDICDKWAGQDPDRLAIIDIGEDGSTQNHSFKDLQDKSNQLANALGSLGVTGLSKVQNIGDRVGVLLPQCVETAVAHIAVTKMGCVSIPLFTLFGKDALLHRLND